MGQKIIDGELREVPFWANKSADIDTSGGDQTVDPPMGLVINDTGDVEFVLELDADADKRVVTGPGTFAFRIRLVVDTNTTSTDCFLIGASNT